MYTVKDFQTKILKTRLFKMESSIFSEFIFLNTLKECAKNCALGMDLAFIYQLHSQTSNLPSIEKSMIFLIRYYDINYLKQPMQIGGYRFLLKENIR